MNPTEILSSEHRVIEIVLDCLERLAEKARGSRRLDIDSADQAVRFLRTFADACHHQKEEQKLFKALEARGLPGHVGPISVMLGEHETGRALLRELDLAISAARAGEQDAAERFAARAGAYVELLRDHIAKEDQVLFPMAEGLLDAATKERLVADFEELERGHAPGTHEEMERIASTLAQRFGVELQDRPQPAATGGCCHHARCDA